MTEQPEDSTSQNRAAYIETLSTIIRAVTQIQDISGVAQETMGLAMRFLHADAASVYLRDALNQDMLTLHTQIGFSTRNVEYFSRHRIGSPTITGQVAAQNVPLFIPDTRVFPYSPQTREIIEQDGIRSHAAVPLQMDRELIGVLNLCWRQGQAFDEETQAFVVGFSNALASGLHNARLYAAIRQHAEQLRSFFDAAPYGILVVNPEGCIVEMNPQSEVLFGYTRSELLGQSIEILVPENLRTQHVQHRANFRTRPRVRSMGHGLDFPARRKDGSEFPAEIGLSPFAMNKGLHTLVTIRDVSEEREIRRQLEMQERLSAIGQLAAGIAHDFSNIMGVISLSAQMLLRTSERLGPMRP